MGHDMTTRMGATMPTWAIEGETPETMEEWEGEWPKRDAVPFVAVTERIDNNPAYFIYDGPRYTDPIGLRPVEVTPEMIAAGLVAYQAGEDDFKASDVTAIYRAMHAASPVALVSDAEIALTRERDEARELFAKFCEDAFLRLTDLVLARDEAIGKFEIVCEHKKRLLHQVASLRAELMAAHDNLAKFTVQSASAVPDAPKHDPFRPRRRDPRRMGPEGI